jgi:hypothetical protein
MTMIPVLFAAFLAGLWFLSIKIMTVTLDALTAPRQRMVPRAYPPADPEVRQPMRHVSDWAFENAYEEDVMFDFRIADQDQSLFCKTWKNAAEKTYLVFYHGLGKNFTELVTIYDDKTGVTTTDAPDAHTLPTVPGAFVQSFPGIDLPELVRRHHAGRATLERRTGLEPQAREEDTLDLIARALERQAGYVMSIPGWRWKGIWWITARKKMMIGKDVGWQLDQFGVYEPPEGLQ